MPVLDSVYRFLDNLFSRRRSRILEEAAERQQAFQEHYRKFRSLLTANNIALELMADLEQALISGRPFGMTFVRSRCTALSLNVFKMILRLQELSGGKYPGLTDAFNSISARLEDILVKEPRRAEGPFILEMNQIDRHAADMVGEKMANLGEIGNRVGLPVPDGFVITAAAAQHFLAASHLRDEINRRLTICNTDNLEELYTTSAAIHQLIVSTPMPDDLVREITLACKRLTERAGGPVSLAVRSSALGEDSGGASFAGQYRTQLNVSEDLLLDAYKEVVAGKYKSQAIIYRLQRGFRHQDVIMCVGCLAMVEARAGGVLYSRSPEDRRSPHVVITAAPGPAGQVVDGRADTDVVLVSRSAPWEILSRTLRRGAAAGVLTEEQARELAQIAVRLEAHFGTPQDIEWAVNLNEKIILLQSRPLSHAGETVIPAAVMPQGYGRPSILTGGTTASGGVASGPVYVVRSDLELLRFPKGAILVVEHPLPDWATLLPRAVGVISETGQAAAHLATVAREFGIPALFGATGAAEKLQDGQIVTLDATGGRVYEGRCEDLLAEQAVPHNLMKGSPVSRVLEEALALVTPLHLTDPSSLYFRPSSCLTLHDLTRFCHEKAVTEMFSYGSRHHIDARTAKQLVGDVPFQWWVVDLEDGFSAEYDRRGKYVFITQITSVPMLAIWDGMTAVPWRGPPPVNIRGFGSIIFQSTMNRELEPAVRSSLANRNYFMISRNFCNLSVRLGYHFALVEAHLGELLTENYVSFQFQGGAADQNRRLIRVQLLKDILQRYNFRVELKIDTLTARIEKKPSPFLSSRLKVLGYLLIHTRQIDMVMEDRDMVEQYRNKILTDIDSMLSGDLSPKEEHKA